PDNENMPLEQQESNEDIADGIAARARKTRVRKLLRNSKRDARHVITDMRPRTLYVHRRVMSAGALIDWAKAHGFETTVPANEMHVTIAYSKTPVDWLKVARYSPWGEDDQGRMRVSPGGARVVEPLGDEGAVVLLFNSSALASRWYDLKECGASW